MSSSKGFLQRLYDMDGLNGPCWQFATIALEKAMEINKSNQHNCKKLYSKEYKYLMDGFELLSYSLENTDNIINKQEKTHIIKQMESYISRAEKIKKLI
tara:strand:- start:671 stop:967 length:297 start_codon:yes stop_codon:yes gene_type:complete